VAGASWGEIENEETPLRKRVGQMAKIFDHSGRNDVFIDICRRSNRGSRCLGNVGDKCGGGGGLHPQRD